MKKQIFLVMITMGLITHLFAQNTAPVAAAVEQLRKAMIDPDSVSLSQVTHSHLSYGHSGGHIEDQKAFIEALTSHKSDFVTIDLTEQTIDVIKNTAVVRHHLSATTNDNGKPATVKLSILSVWVKDKGHWKMLARQAVHI